MQPEYDFDFSVNEVTVSCPDWGVTVNMDVLRDYLAASLYVDFDHHGNVVEHVDDFRRGPGGEYDNYGRTVVIPWRDYVSNMRLEDWWGFALYLRAKKQFKHG